MDIFDRQLLRRARPLVRRGPRGTQLGSTRPWFPTTAGTRFAVPIHENGTLGAHRSDVYIGRDWKNSRHDNPTEPVALEVAADALVDDVTGVPRHAV